MSNDNERRPSTAAPARLLALAIILCACLPVLAAAQGARQPAANNCPPRRTARGPVFVFGNEGGNMKRSASKLWANGSVQVVPGRRTAPDAAIADSVAALSRFARQSAFWTTTAPRITRPTRNPDMARHYLEAHLQCGTKRSLYPADAEPAAFHELITRLTAVAGLAAGR